MKSRLLEFLKAKTDRQRLIGVLIVGVLAILGVTFLISSHAQSPYASSETETGHISEPASTIADSNASGASAVQFGCTATTCIRIKGTTLVNGLGHTVRLIGLDESGTEGACLNGGQAAYLTFPDPGTSPDWPTGIIGNATLDNKTAAEMASWNINAVRIPLNEDCWIGATTGPNAISIINPYDGKPSPYVGAAYQTAIEDFVTALNNHGITAILGLFYIGPGTVQADSGRPMADADHALTFWTSVANAFKGNQSVMYNTYNEPHFTSANIIDGTQPWQCWLNGCKLTWTELQNNVSVTFNYTSAGEQQMVDAIRATGAAQPILVDGINWSSDPCGISSPANKQGDTHSCSQTANMPTDPDHQLAVDYHLYYTWMCYSVSCATSTLSQVNSAGYPLIPTEIGENDCSSQYFNQLLSWADTPSVNLSYMAWDWQPPGKTNSTLSGPAAYTCAPKSNFNYSLLYSYDGAPNSYPGYQQAQYLYNHFALPAVVKTEK